MGTPAATSTAQNTVAPELAELETFDFVNHVQQYEIELLKQAMKRAQFNQRKAADFLQMSYHQLRGYLRKYDLLG
jgi:psp operon transcriptional activator